MQLIAAPWPLSSSSACPGCRTSRIRILLLSWENVARRWASWGEAARRRRGGAYDMVCWAAVGERFPGLLDAVGNTVSLERYAHIDVGGYSQLTFVAFFVRLVNDGAVLETSKIKHPDAAVSATGDEYINAVCTEANVKDFFIVCDELSLSGKGRDIPYRAGRVNTGGDD